VVQEIGQLVADHGVKEIHFEDDNLTNDRARMLEICRRIKEQKWGITWATPTGLVASKLDDELLGEMAASGCYSITLAIESGNQQVLSKLMHKPVNLARIPEMVKNVRKHGMLAKGFFMLGYPGETTNNIMQTVEFAKSLELDWAFFFIATPLPYTQMYDTSLALGYLKPGGFNPMTSLHESVIQSDQWDNEWLAEVREKAIIDINFTNNPNIQRNPEQAIADLEHVQAMYPHFTFIAEPLARARRNLGRV
jgi:radical SAM superfamily enzyme YgiQ (UPF0313 family)